MKANGAGAPGDGDIQCNSIPAVANTITLLDTDSYADLGSTFDFELRVSVNLMYSTDDTSTVCMYIYSHTNVKGSRRIADSRKRAWSMVPKTTPSSGSRISYMIHLKYM